MGDKQMSEGVEHVIGPKAADLWLPKSEFDAALRKAKADGVREAIKYMEDDPAFNPFSLEALAARIEKGE